MCIVGSAAKHIIQAAELTLMLLMVKYVISYHHLGEAGEAKRDVTDQQLIYFVTLASTSHVHVCVYVCMCVCVQS